MTCGVMGPPREIRAHTEHMASKADRVVGWSGRDERPEAAWPSVSVMAYPVCANKRTSEKRQRVLARGTFISLEGIDGCGKSTQISLLADDLRSAGYTVLCLREPGGTAIGEKIRSVLLDPTNQEMAAECELLLMESSRAQLVRQVVEPALAKGTVVICDRFFDSTYAYQHGGRGLVEDVVRAANALGSCGVVPDVAFVLDLPVDVAFERAIRGGADRLEAEGRAFQERVRGAYLHLAERESHRVAVVNADAPADVVHASLVSLLDAWVPSLGLLAVRKGR